MNFEDKEIDDKKLLEEIDKLEDNNDSEVIIDSIDDNDEVIVKNDNTKNIVCIVLLVLVILAYLIYENAIKRANNISFENTLQIPEYIDEYQIKNNKGYEKNDSSYYDDDDYYSYYYDYYLDDYDEETEKKNREIFERLKTNVKTTFLDKDEEGVALIKLENNNDEAIYDFEVYAIFYDSSNKPISVKEETVDYIGPGKTFYLSFYSITDKYSKVETLIDKEYFDGIEPKNIVDSIEYDVVEESDQIVVKGKNIGKTLVDQVLFQILYFDKNGNIISEESSYEFDIRKNKEFEMEFYKPYDPKTYEDIDYSSYKVELMYALEEVPY